MKDLFLSVQSRMIEKVSDVLIDLDYGQLDNYEMRPNLTFPAALIKMKLIPQNISEDGAEQRITANVGIRLAFKPTVNRTSSATESKITRMGSIDYLDKARLLYVQVQGWYNDTYSPWECTAMEQETRNDGLVVIAFQFTTTYLDTEPTTVYTIY